MALVHSTSTKKSRPANAGNLLHNRSPTNPQYEGRVVVGRSSRRYRRSISAPRAAIPKLSVHHEQIVGYALFGSSDNNFRTNFLEHGGSPGGRDSLKMKISINCRQPIERRSVDYCHGSMDHEIVRQCLSMQLEGFARTLPNSVKFEFLSTYVSR